LSEQVSGRGAWDLGPGLNWCGADSRGRSAGVRAEVSVVGGESGRGEVCVSEGERVTRSAVNRVKVRRIDEKCG
jgi:hypothetical protein